MGNVDFKKLIIASISGTAAMTVIMLMAPMMDVEMDMGEMLGTDNPMIEMPYMMGWVMHFIIGIVITWVYAAFLIDRLPSDGWKRGMIYSLIPWAAMNFMAMPMMGMGVFSGGTMAIMGGIVAHFAYGGVMGAIYTGETAEEEAAPAAAPEPEPTPEPEASPEPTPEPEPAPEPEPEAPSETPAEEDSAAETEESSDEGEKSEEAGEEDSGSDEEETESGEEEKKPE